jgi:N-acetylmuramoyl-L-alanine amidase
MKINDEGYLMAEIDDPTINLDKISTDKTSGRFKSNSYPDTIIIHYTAGTTARGAVGTLVDPAVKASAHIVIDNDGTITQLIPFTHIGWHAGKSSFNGRVGYNKYSLGIEIVNPGFLNKAANGSFKTVYGNTIPEEQVVFLTHRNEQDARYWQSYHDIQVEAVRKICLAMRSTYNIQFILGHEEISPGRKTDPGPAFPLDSLRSSILENRSSDEEEVTSEGKVAVTSLNIRASADGGSQKVALPLKKNSVVQIMEEKNGWYKVSTKIEGWVSAEYIKS